MRTRVVIAEDHTLVREGTREILERAGDIDVVGEAADGDEALALVATLQPDVAIIDVGMPRMNGIEATRRIKAEHPQIGVVILTVHDDDQCVFALLEAGAAGYLLKDVPGAELVEAVRAVRCGEPVLQASIAQRVLSHFTPDRGSSASAQPITQREMEILRHAARGLSNKEIARTLGLSARTVQGHLAHIFLKLGVASRTEAVIGALRRGWFGLEELS